MSGFGFCHSLCFQRKTIGLSQEIQSKFLYLWTGKFSGNNLLSDLDSNIITVTGKDFSSKYIPSTTAATFRIPNDQDFIDADSDNIWYQDDFRQVTAEELVTYDFSRTIVKYSNVGPHNISAIGILKYGETLTANELNAVFKYFELSVYWNDSYNDNGRIKENRAEERSVYAPAIAPNGDCSLLSITVESDSKITLNWTNGSTNEDGISIERSTDGSSYSSIDTTGSGVESYSDETCNPSTRYYYRVRAKKGSLYSDYSNVADDYSAVPLPLTGAGTGSAVARIAVRVITTNVTMKLEGTNCVWCDSGGSAETTELKTITTGGLRNFYLKVKDGAGATGKILIFAKNNLQSLGDSTQTGWLFVTDGPSIEVDFDKMPSSMINLRIDGASSIIGSINSISNNAVYWRGSFKSTSYTSGKAWSNAINYFSFTGVTSFGLDSTEVDNLIHDLAQKTWSGATKVCKIDGSNARRTHTSDADKTSLEAQGVTCTFNEPL